MQGQRFRELNNVKVRMFVEVISFNPLIIQMRKPRPREVKRQEDWVVGKFGEERQCIQFGLYYICDAHGKSRF